MEQSVYTRISKQIGVTGNPIPLPSKEKAQLLSDQVQLADIDAFRDIFRYYRFGDNPKNDEERDVLNIICEAFNYGAKLFQSQK